MVWWWKRLGIRWTRLVALAVLATVVVSVLARAGAPPVEAHATLIRSNPENGSQERRPPARVILYFSEPVEPRLTNIEVFDLDREQVDEQDVEVDPDNRTIASVGVPTLDPGLYTVEFSNVSTVDGHPWSGVIQFIILNPDGTVPPGAEFNPDAESGAGGTGLLPENIDSALKWIALLALCITAGAAVFASVVVRPAAAFLEDEAYREATEAGEAWVVTVSHILLPASFIALAVLVVVSINRFDTTTSLFDYLTDIRAGRYQLANMILVTVALVGADLLYLARGAALKRAGMAVLMAASAGAMLCYSLISHGATGEGKFWSVTSDFLHLAASAAWLGALVLLIPLLRWARAHLTDESTRFLFLANAFDRFSVLAGLSVAIVLVTGVFNGLVEIPEWGAFTDTTYGRVLLAKLIIVGLLLPVAGLNALILKPRLVAAIDAQYQEGGSRDAKRRERSSAQLAGLQRALPITIAVEVALVVAVFASVAVLTQTSTAKGEIAQEEAARKASTEFTDVRDAGDLRLGLEVTPNRVGINRYTLSIQDLTGAAIATVTQARLRFTYVNPSQPDVVQPVAELLLRASIVEGEYEGQGAYFTQPGTWQVEAGVRRSDGDDVSRTFVVSASPTETAAADDGGPYALPFDSLQWNNVLGALVVILGALILAYRQQIRPLAKEAYRVGVTVAMALIIGGAALWFAVDTHDAVADPSANNPVAATEESIETGRMLFQQNCVVCHGAEGRGDGPQAAALDPSPADLRQHLPLHTDTQFFAFVADGVGGTAMPAWREQLSEEDIWNLINFLRAEFQTIDEE